MLVLVLEATLALAALAAALAMRPWRLLSDGQLLGPLLACLVLLPWPWALPALHDMPLQLHWSGACLVLLMLGWPLAVPTLLVVAGAAGLIAQMAPEAALSLAVWRGVVPATLGVVVGAALRRWLPPHLFVYTIGRAFLGTAVSIFAAGLLARWADDELANVTTELSTVALWLVAWADAVITGMLVAIFVAFRPHWLATWSDQRYLAPPRKP